jgi:hypothetical protein
VGVETDKQIMALKEENTWTETQAFNNKKEQTR